MTENERKATPPKTEEEINRTTGAALGGAILGGSLGGPVGALIGGVVGYLLGDKANEVKRKEGDKNNG